MCERVVMPNGAVAIVCRGHKRKGKTMAIGSIKPSKSGEGGDFELVSAGQHVAMLVAIIDLGTQDTQYQGTWSTKHKVFFGWEILDQKQKDGSPFRIGIDYTMSGASNGNFRPMVEGWLGKTLPEGVDYAFHAPAKDGGLLGRYCLLNIAHAKSGKGKDIAKIMGVSAVPQMMRAGAAALKPSRAPFVWEIESADVPSLAEEMYLFGQKLSAHISAAHERGGGRKTGTTQQQPVGAGARSAGDYAASAPQQPSGFYPEPSDDDIPF